MDTLAVFGKQSTTRDGRWFTVRILPYRAQKKVIDAVVITFIDINITKS